MRPTSEQCEAYWAHELVPGVSLEHNSPVRVVAGEHAGALGSIISIDDLDPDPVFLVELVSGDDVLIRQSFLRLEEELNREA